MKKTKNLIENPKYKCKIIDQFLHEADVELSIIPELDMILNVPVFKDKSKTIRFRVTNVIPISYGKDTYYEIRVESLKNG